MIDINVKIHDKFSVEMKIGFVTKRNTEINDFAVNMWIFVPNSLDINALTYSKSQFYRDIKSNVRLITPVFLLREIADWDAAPLRNLKHAFGSLAADPSRVNAAEYEYQIKMFMAILKSSLRDEISHIVCTALPGDIEHLCNEYLGNIEKISKAYRELRHIVNVPTIESEVLNYYLFGDEFMSNLVLRGTFKLIRKIEKQHDDNYSGVVAQLTQLIVRETEYAQLMGYPVVETESANRNRDVIFRNGVLKKYIESDLFLSARQKEDGAFVKQMFYSFAAGIAMVFATAVAFLGAQRWGNFTLALFVALVVSYMLKDRIKELMRYYFAYKLKNKYFDNKTTISIKDKPIGWIKEGVDFVTDGKVPREVLEIRSRSPLLQAENRINDEKIILYRKMVSLDDQALRSEDKYLLTGINNIIRLHLTNFVSKMDNPEQPLYTLEENGKMGMVYGDKIYYLNFVIQLQYDGIQQYKRFRLVFNRSGIKEIEELK